MLHFVVTWEIYVEGEQEGELHRQFMDCLQGYDIVHLLSGTLVVKIRQQQEYAELHKQWADIAADNKGRVEFIMSPLMKAGQYAGYFRQEKWEQLTSALDQGTDGSAEG